MSTLGFEVHLDKENATPAGFGKGAVGKNFGARNRDKLTQPTPRKALLDVNHGPQLSASRAQTAKNFGISGNVQKETLFNLKTGMKISTGVENRVKGSSVLKAEKKTPSVNRKNVKKAKVKGSESQLHPAKLKIGKSKKEPPTKQGCIPQDEEYDSDSIFPRSERLSTYVDKLLAWRPPCLFGILPDSEPEVSEPEDVLNDDIILDLPVSLSGVPDIPDYNLHQLMVELPPLDIISSEPNLPEQDVTDTLQEINDHKYPELSLEPTPNTSLSLGSLDMINSSLNTSSVFQPNHSALTENPGVPTHLSESD